MKKSQTTQWMRREYRGVLRVVGTLIAVLLLSCALQGIIAAVCEETAVRRASLLGAMVCLILCLGVAGFYFVVSDDKWLLRHTPFGHALARLGNAAKLRDQIDQAVRTPLYRCDQFLLLPGWMILVRCQGCQTDPLRRCFCPLPQNAISQMEMEKDQEDTGYNVTLSCAGIRYGLYVWDVQDLMELRKWMEVLESNHG